MRPSILVKPTNFRALRALPVGFAVATAGLATAACASGAAPPPETPVVVDPDHAAAIDSARPPLRRAAERTAGLAVAVYRAGEPVWLEGMGYADVGARTPVDPERTRFRVYSLAKPMTAVAALRLVEAGRLDPSAPIQDHVPGFPEASAPITALQLGTHTAGIRHYADEMEARDPGHCDTVTDALPIFAGDPLVRAPGSGESYSSWGFVLLSAVIAAVEDAPFPAAMDRLVFGPAGMDGVTLDDPTIEVPHRATPYERPSSGAELVLAPPVDNSCKWGAGGFVATVDDIARFGVALLGGELVSERGLAMFLRGSGVYAARGIGVGGTALLHLDARSGTVVVLAGNTSGDPAVTALRDGMERLTGLF